jgi:hypothetical protein
MGQCSPDIQGNALVAKISNNGTATISHTLVIPDRSAIISDHGADK